MAGEAARSVGTWDDWAAPGARRARQITRDELRVMLDNYHLATPVTDSALRVWESSGLLPQPVRGVRDGVYRPLYPIWAVTVMMTLRWYQGHVPNTRGTAGRENLIPLLRQAARQASLMSGPNARLPPPPLVMYASQYPLAADHLTGEQIAYLAAAIEAVFQYRWEPGGQIELSPFGRSPFPLVKARVTVVDSQGVEYAVEVPIARILDTE